MEGNPQKNSARARVLKINGAKLAALRNRHFKTQGELADAMGMKERNYGRLEQRKDAGMFWRRVPQLAAVFGLAPDDLVQAIAAEGEQKNGRLAADAPLTLSPELSAKIREFAARENRDPLEWIAWAVAFCEPGARPAPATGKGVVLPHRPADQSAEREANKPRSAPA